MTETEKAVRQVLCEVLGNDSPLAVNKRADLQANCGMDSMNCMQIVIALEDIFDILVPCDKLGMRFVRTVEDICQLVEEERV